MRGCTRDSTQPSEAGQSCFTDEAPAIPPPREQRIPARGHFIWFGQQFPWVNVLAIKSAVARGGFDEVVLHHDSDLTGTPHYAELMRCRGLRLSPIDVPGLLEKCEPFSGELRGILGRLKTFTTRSDLARFALLYSEGGVYLDMDTVTLADFRPLLREARAFCGRERIVYPASVRHSWNPLKVLPAHARAVLRDVWRRLPHGYRHYLRHQGLYSLAENPAVLASAARAPFVTAALREMILVPPHRQAVPCAIGPHLLQHVAPRFAVPELRVHAPEVFFPLGPEISEHWFRLGRRASLSEVIAPTTRLVHWYASVRTKQVVPRIDPAYVRRHASEQLFSALALPFLD